MLQPIADFSSLPNYDLSTVTIKRFDPITPVHKTARYLMFEVTTQVGALDVTDLIAIAHCTERVQRLFSLLDCDDAEVKLLLHALLESDVVLRRDTAADLYRALNRVVSNQLVVQQLEIAHTSMLWEQHTDSELRTLRYNQLAMMSDRELADAMRGMEVALSPQEITAVLNDVQTNVSPEYFVHLLNTLNQMTIAPRLQQSAREFGIRDGGSPRLEQRPEDIDHSHPAQRSRAPARAHRATRRRTSNR